jgi:hypothetical protein
MAPDRPMIGQSRLIYDIYRQSSSLVRVRVLVFVTHLMVSRPRQVRLRRVSRRVAKRGGTVLLTSVQMSDHGRFSIWSAAGVTIAASIMLAAGPAGACDRLPCPTPSNQAAVSSKPETAVKPRQSATRMTAAAKSRDARSSDRRKRHAQSHARSHRSRVASAARPTSRAGATAQIRLQTSAAAARRFREFVNPRPIAANPIDELRKPRPVPADLIGDVAFPAAAMLVLTAARETPAEAEQAFSQDELNEIDLAAVPDRQPYRLMSADSGFVSTQPPPQSPATAAIKSTGTERSPAGMTWLQLLFVTWGGVLTLASAVRLFLG